MVMELNEDCGINLGNLCPQVIDSIFSRISLKPLTKLKCVSRAWCKFINDFRRFNPPTTNSGLVLLLNRQKHQSVVQELIFIEAQKHCRRWLVDPEDGKFCSTTYSNHDWFKHSNSRFHLIDSCNGLLLYGTNDAQYWTYHVVNPFLGEFFALPQVHEVRRLACASLVLDKSYQNKNFRIIYTFLEEIDVMEGSMGCKIFSSETREWREIQARISNLYYLIKDGFNKKQLFDHRVFSKGRLYWIWSICMLVYDDGVESFKLIPLPLKAAQIKRNQLDMRSQLLWESDRHIYFCYERNQVISIFKFIMEDDNLSFREDDHCKACSFWQFTRFVQLQDINYPELNHLHGDKQLKFKRRRVGPCAFNEDLQLLFLFVRPARIVGYSLETGELEPVWYCEELIGSTSSNVNGVKPFLFKNSVHHLAC